MRNKVVILVGLLLICAGLLFVNMKHLQMVHDREVRQRALQTQLEANNARIDALHKQVVEQNTQLLAQCKVGVDSWNKLTPLQQKTQPKPDCELSFQ